MADQPDWGQVESQLKQKAGQWYDPSMLGDVQRNASYGAGEGTNNLDDWINRVANKAQLRGGNEANSTYVANQQGGITVGPTGKVNSPTNPQPTIAAGTLSPSAANSGTPTGAPGWFTDWSNQQRERQKILDSRSDSLYGALMSRAQQSLDINPNDPIIKAQVDAFRAEQDRGRRNAISDMAESSGPYANLSVAQTQLGEKAARATAGLQASLMGSELTARRQEIQNALTGMAGLLTPEQQLALQQELGLIDANLRQQGITSSNDQFAQEFGRSLTNDANYWNQQRLAGF